MTPLKRSVWKPWLIDGLGYTLLFSVYLAFPRWVAVGLGVEQGWAPAAFVNLTLNLGVILAALRYSLRGGPFGWVVYVLVQALFCARVLEFSLFKIFGQGFNEAFFFHFTAQSLWLALKLYGLWALPLLVVGLGLFSWALAWPGRLSAGPRRWGLGVFLLLLALRGGWQIEREFWQGEPYLNGLKLVHQGWLFYHNPDLNLEPKPGEWGALEELGLMPVMVERLEGTTEPPDLILIYLEGWTGSYSSLTGGPEPGLTPNLDRFAQQNLHFTGLHNSATTTINALASFTCGLNARLGDSAKVKTLALGTDCYSGLLAERGYRQVFWAGSPISYAGRDRFFLSQGFDAALGLDRILAQEPDWAERTHTWGLYDADLFSFLQSEVDRLRQAEQPYHLATLTLNTHPSYYHAPECPQFRPGEARLNAVFCTDWAVGQFLDYLEETGVTDEAVIALVGDHQPHGGGGGLYGPLYFAASTPQGHQGRIDTLGYSPDLAPTLFELMGFEAAQWNLGKSLLSARKEYPYLFTRHYRLSPTGLHRTQPCPPERFEQANLSAAKPPALSNCQQQRALALAQRKLLE